jgi:hypothetical protein
MRSRVKVRRLEKSIVRDGRLLERGVYLAFGEHSAELVQQMLLTGQIRAPLARATMIGPYPLTEQHVWTRDRLLLEFWIRRTVQCFEASPLC